jgi:hypothetical protein
MASIRNGHRDRQSTNARRKWPRANGFVRIEARCSVTRVKKNIPPGT